MLTLILNLALALVASARPPELQAPAPGPPVPASAASPDDPIRLEEGRGAEGSVPRPEAVPVERARYLMGTVCRIHAFHPRPGAASGHVERAFEEIARWESILSDYDPASELSRLNAGAAAEPVRCSTDLFAFLETASVLAERTGGAFDPTVGPLIDAYDLRGGGRWPSPGTITAALGSVGYGRIALDRESMTARFLAGGMRLDPGGIGKGIALDAEGRAF